MVGCLVHGSKEKDKRDGIFKDSLTKETTQGSLVNNFKIMKLTKLNGDIVLVIYVIRPNKEKKERYGNLQLTK